MSWERVKIKEIGTVITGKTPSTSNNEYFGGDVPFVTPTDFRAYSKNIFNAIRYLSSFGVKAVANKLLPKNSILVTCIGSDMGKVMVNQVPCVTNQQINSIIPDPGLVDANFLYYTLVDMYDLLKNMSTGGSTMPIVNKSDFENIELFLPPLEEQRRIASILTALDDKIELNRRMNTTLEGIAGALWEEWFGKESDKLTTLDSLIEFNPKVSIKANQEVTYVEMKDLQSNSLNVSSFTKRTFTSGSKFELNDTLMARITPCLENGKTAFVNFLAKGEKGFGSTEFIILRARKNSSPFFVYFMARNETFRQYAINSMVGSSGRQRVQSNLLPNYEIAQPDTNLMNDFDRFVAPLFEKILINSRENVSLSSTRDILLYHFFQTKTKNHEIA